MKTRDKIIDTALALFNEKGERNITTNHISTHLKISPGNLYYHFHNKQEIIREIFASYASELLALFTPRDEQQQGLILFKHYLDAIFTLIWKYRFLYANLPQILQQDALLHEQYRMVQEQSKKNLHASFSAFIKLKLIHIEEEDLDTITTSLHMIILSWLSYQSSLSLKTEITEQVIRQGMLQMTAMIKPFTTQLGRQQLLVVEKELKDLIISGKA